MEVLPATRAASPEIVSAGFINKVTKTPVVNTATTCTTGAYGEFKDPSPPVIKKHSSSAEETTNHYATTSVSPIVEEIRTKFNKQIQNQLPARPEIVSAGFVTNATKTPGVNTAISCVSSAYGRFKDLTPPVIKKHSSSSEETVNPCATTSVSPVVEEITTEFNKPIQDQLRPRPEIVSAGFITQVTKIPVVNTAIICASGAYGKVKDLSPPVIKKHWSSAEETVNHYATTSVLPVVEAITTKFNKPIHAVDAMACQTLDKVIQTLPVLNKSPTEMIISTCSSAMSAINVVSGVADLLLSNRLGNWSLKLMESSIGSVHHYIDHFIPPVTSVAETPAVPNQPSQKIYWAIFQIYDAMKKVQHRLYCQAQETFKIQSANALVAFGGLVGLLDWVSINWKENKFMQSVPDKLQELANFFRGPTDGEKNCPATLFDNVISMASYFSNRCAVFIRGTLKALDNIIVSKPVTILRLQLSVALAVTTHFATAVIQTWTAENLIEKTNQFFTTEFPLVKNALLLAEKMTADSPDKDKVL